MTETKEAVGRILNELWYGSVDDLQYQGPNVTSSGTNDIQNAHKCHLYLSESVAPESVQVPNLDSSAHSIPDDDSVAI